MKTTKALLVVFLVLGLTVCQSNVSGAEQMGTAFTYQGHLYDNNDGATGLYDFQAKLFDDPNGNFPLAEANVSEVDVRDSLFTLELDFGGGIFDGNSRWLQIGIRPGELEEPNAYTVLRPRQQVTAAPYALYAKMADNDNDWQVFNNIMYSIPSGNVGIGTTEPEAKLDIANPLSGPAVTVGRQTGNPSIVARSDASGGWLIVDSNGAGNVGLNYYDSGHVILVKGGGKVGIGTTGPEAKLSIQMPAGTELLPADTPGLVIKDAQYNGGKQIDVQNSAGVSRFVVDGSGRVGIARGSPQSELDVAGRTRTEVLEITGGSDLAEPFNVCGERTARPGMVVSIDPENPGQLVVCNSAYDMKVAGIISGAGNINTGMLMGQSGSRADGSLPVALTGRVYCLADASNGVIRPGDLLTTSQTPGHAMKVTDHDRANGAILGKAMTGLEAGEKGLVLVLVALQ
ncbi:MAG: hypothetical protein ACYTEL_02095 [Planctomycetota bacterium]|jgi:hypothetical protein